MITVRAVLLGLAILFFAASALSPRVAAIGMPVGSALFAASFLIVGA